MSKKTSKFKNMLGMAVCAVLVGLTPGLVEGQVYVSEWGSFGSGNGQFNFAIDIDQDASGNLYVVEYNGNRVQKWIW